MSNWSGVILKARDFKVQGNNVYVTKNNGNPGMLLLKAEWCHFCKQFQSTFNEIANSIGNDFSCMSIDSEDITQELTLALNFQGFPTIKFVDQKGKILGEYQGDRSKIAILKEICKVFHHCISTH